MNNSGRKVKVDKVVIDFNRNKNAFKTDSIKDALGSDPKNLIPTPDYVLPNINRALNAFRKRSQTHGLFNIK